jgi:hypothetical protein
MQIPVLIEPVAGNGFRARGGEPLSLTAEGTTPGEALQSLRHLIDARLGAGAQLVALDVQGTEHPWLPFAGMFQDDPLIDEWKQAMAHYRRAVDEDPNIP